MLGSRGIVWLPVLLVILGLLAVSGGAYWYAHSQPAAPQEPLYQPAATTQAPAQTTPVQTPPIKQTSPTSVPGMSQYTDANLGITFYAPPGLQAKITSTAGVPSNFDYCVNMIDPAKIGANYAGGDGTLVTLCKTQTSLFAEQGYWGDTVYYYFDTTKDQWMYAVHGTGSDQPGSSSIATTTATAEALTLAGDPIFVGTGAHSCISRIVPTSRNTFVYIRDRLCSDYDPTSFISRFAQTFDRIGHTPGSANLQQVLQNELAAIAKYAY